MLATADTASIEARKKKITSVLEETKSAKSLSPADFYFAFKQGLLEGYIPDFKKAESQEVKEARAQVAKAKEEKKQTRAERDVRIMSLHNEGIKIKEIADVVGLSPLRVRNIIKKGLQDEK